jgi:tetratricopeptide (TPR) repeat protein
MQTRRLLTALLTLACSLTGFLGCDRDPNVKKQKFVASGDRYFEKGEYPEAIIEYSNAIQADPQYGAAHFKLGESFLKTQRFPEAYRELQRAVDLDPGNNKASLDLGLLLIAGRSYSSVPAIAAKMLEQNAKNADAHLLLSELSRVQGQLDVALREIQLAISLDPAQPQFYAQLAALQAAGGNKTGAEISLKKSLELDPKFVPGVQSLAGLYESSGDWSDAEKQLLYAIQLEPKRAELRKELAQLYFSQQRKPEAEQLMVQAKKDLGRTGDLYRVLGEYYNNIGESDKALEEFASISREHPDDVRTNEDYIRLLLSHGQIDKAGKLNDAILKGNPKETGAQIIRGTILNLQNKFDEAAAILEGALKGEPENAYGHFQFGLALSKTRNLERAQQEWFQAAKLAPHMVEAQLALAQIALTKGDTQLLRETADHLVESNPSDPRGYMLRAESEIKGKQSAAEDDLKKAIEVAPQNPTAYSAMGDLLRKQGKSDAAQRFYEQALDRDPNYIQPLTGIASILLSEKQNAKAVERVKKQAEKTSNNDSVYFLLGGMQVANKDLSGAEASLQRALQLNPSNMDAIVLLSKVEMARGDGDRALATAYKSIADNPKKVDAYFFAGTMEELSGRPQKAEDVYRKALLVDPNFAPAANNLAYLMLQNGENIDIALSHARMARQKMPDSPSAADTLAWIYYQKGLYDSAADLLREALQKSPDNATYHYHIGMVYRKQNNSAAAKQHLQRALQINPNFPAASEIRKTLNQLS